jgi:integrase
MAGLVSKPLLSGKRRAWFMDWRGKQIFFTGTTNPKETLRMAERHEDHHTRIKEGDLPPPKASDMPREFLEVAAEYLAWGAAQGGHGGRAWSPVHSAMRTRHLTKFWPARLNSKTLTDVTLPKVEETARELLKSKTGKTVQAHVESIKALCRWAESRGYLDENPMEGMAAFDTTPKTTRRALSAAEISKLLEAAPAERRIVYETAMCTGYRKGELTALRVSDLHVDTCSLTLAAADSKGRRASRQPIPEALSVKLKAASQGKPADAPLLYVDKHIDRLFFRDFKAAGMTETGPGGSLVFHSLRHTYCSLVIESGASLTEAQRLLRHQDPKLTANVYSHARQDRLQSTAEAVGDKVIWSENYATSMQRLAVGAEAVDVKTCDEMTLAVSDNENGKGFEPLHPLIFHSTGF